MVSVCLCAHPPSSGVFRECLEAIRSLEIPADGLELVVIGGASSDAPPAPGLDLEEFPFPVRQIRVESQPGTPGGLLGVRRRAVCECRGDVVILIGGNDLLRPDYAVAAARFFRECPRAGFAAGTTWPRFGALPPSWFDDFAGSLGLRNLGPERLRPAPGLDRTLAGAGAAFRGEALRSALAAPLRLAEAPGADLELGAHLERLGWEGWYEPAMQLERLLPAEALGVDHLARCHEAVGAALGLVDALAGRQPADLPARLFRRAWYHRRLAGQESRCARTATDATAQARDRIRAAYHRGRASGLVRLALSRNSLSRTALPSAPAGSARAVNPTDGCISVVIPTYNRAGFIIEAIASVIAQGPVIGEIIVVDDGSTDNTLAVVRKIGDPRIRLTSQANRGPAAARERGWRLARGEFIQFLDSDDVLPGGTSQRMLVTARRHPGYVVYGGVTYHGSDAWGPVCAEGAIAERSGWIIEEVSRMSFGTIFSSLIPREALVRIGGFEMPAEFLPCEDFEFALRLALDYPFVREPAVCYRVRLHDSNRHTTSLEPMHRARLASVRRHVPLTSMPVLKLRAQAFHRGLIADHQLARGDYLGAIQGYLRCILWWPPKLRAYRSLAVALLQSLVAPAPSPAARTSPAVHPRQPKIAD